MDTVEKMNSVKNVINTFKVPARYCLYNSAPRSLSAWSKWLRKHFRMQPLVTFLYCFRLPQCSIGQEESVSHRTCGLHILNATRKLGSLETGIKLWFMNNASRTTSTRLRRTSAAAVAAGRSQGFTWTEFRLPWPGNIWRACSGVKATLKAKPTIKMAARDAQISN